MRRTFPRIARWFFPPLKGAEMTLRTDLIAWYRNNGTDRSGNGRHMTGVPSNPGTTTGLGGAANAAMLGSGGLTYWQLTDATAFPGPDFSIAGWGKSADVHAILHARKAGDLSWMTLNWIEDTLGLNAGTSLVNYPVDLRDDAWHHVVGTYTTAGQVAKLYLDGALVASSSSVGPLVFNSTYFRVLDEAAVASAMQFVGVWSRALTLAHVVQLYNGGAGYDPTA